MVENKQVMAKNILYYMEINNVNATDICKACGFKQNTFSDWVNAKTYPRIDKIELMAQYFNVNKACLVEEHKELEDTTEAKRIRELYSIIPPEILDDSEQYAQIKDLVNTYLHADSDGRSALLGLLKNLQPKS